MDKTTIFKPKDVTAILNSLAMRIFFILLLQFSFGHVFSQTDTCSVQISLDTTVIPRQLVTSVTGTPPFLYEWNNTRQTDKITLNQSGNYNVTVTDAKNCISTAEFNYDQCSVTIVADTTDNGILLRAEVIGTPPFQYFWGDDARIETSIPNGTGNYVVTITDGTGCAAADEYAYTDLETISKNKIWQNVIYPTFNPETEFINYQFLKDTLINGQSYQQLFSKNLSSPQPEWKSLNTFLREVQDKIYILNSDLSESLLYDFSLTINDTFHLQYNSYDCVFLVKAVDSLSLSTTETRKRITLIKANDPNPEQPEYGYNYWVEGIGSLTSLVNYGASCYTDYSTNLLCFYDYKALAYENSSIGNCLLTNITEPLSKPIKIFPNPSHHTIFIESSVEIIEIQVFNALGRKIQVNRNHQELDIRHLAKGMYWLTIKTKNHLIFSKTFIKH